MSHYRRLRVPGGTYFFTVRLFDRRSDLLVREVALLRDCVGLAQKRWPFYIADAVVLPNMTHMIWTLPPDDADFSKRWRLIKSAFSRQLPPPRYRSASMMAKGEKGIWQRRFWEHQIRDADDLAAHRHLILTAPVQAGLVSRPDHWPYTSLHHRSVPVAPTRAGNFGPFVAVP